MMAPRLRGSMMAMASSSVAPASVQLDLARHVAEVEKSGYTVVPGVFPVELCARAISHMDAVLEPCKEQHHGPVSRSHPIPGSVMAELFSAPKLLAVASAMIGTPSHELRLFEQVLLRTARVPEDMMDQPVPTARGWHVDDVFAPEQFAATPRQTYQQMFAVLSDIEPGAGGTMVVPGSHKQVMAAAYEHSRGKDGFTYDATAWAAYDRDTLLKDIQARPRDFGIEPDAGVEFPCAAGSLVVFCPDCLHSSSENRSKQGASRYVVVQSFYHATAATLLQERYARMRYLKGFHCDLHAAVSPALRPMLYGRALWGAAMRRELAEYQETGVFTSPQPVVGRENVALIERLARELEPEWHATEFPVGVDRFAALFLMILKASGERLSLVTPDRKSSELVMEDSVNLALAAELLGLDETLASTFGRDLNGVVLSGCGIGNSAQLLASNAALEKEDRKCVAFLTDLDAGQVAERTVICSCTPALFRAVGMRRCFGWWYSANVRDDSLAVAVRHVFGAKIEGWDEKRRELWGLTAHESAARL